jgi:hypothetical protein
MPSASFAMKDPTFEDEYYKRYAVSVASTTPSQYDWELKKCASIDSESMLEPEYPRPTRLYQCALVLAGFFATFQTIGLNQTYGIFQASPLAESLPLCLHKTSFKQDFYTSSESNIIDGPGRYAMASLIGTIGGGLTWSGSVFVAMLISKGCDMCVMCLSGAALMSLGFILASLATRVCTSSTTVPAFD